MTDVQAVQADEVKDEALKTVREELRTLLIKFQRSQKYFAKHLPEHVKEDTEEEKKKTVKFTYQLLRTFCFTYNFITITDKETDKFVIPTDFEAELKEVMTKDYFDKFTAAIKSPKEDFEKELPDHVTEQVVEKLLKFVSVKQTNHIVDKYEDLLKTLTEKIEAKTEERDAIKPPVKERRNSERRQRNPRKNSRSDSDDSGSVEERLQSILNEVSKRSDSVRFSKDDFESLSEAQTQLDALMRETVSEIFKMKQRLRKRFAKVQSSKRRNSRTNRRRN